MCGTTHWTTETTKTEYIFRSLFFVLLTPTRNTETIFNQKSDKKKNPLNSIIVSAQKWNHIEDLSKHTEKNQRRFPVTFLLEFL